MNSLLHAGAAGILLGSQGRLLLANMRRQAAQALVGQGGDKFGQNLSRILMSKDPEINRRTLQRLTPLARRYGLSAAEMVSLLTG